MKKQPPDNRQIQPWRTLTTLEKVWGYSRFGALVFYRRLALGSWPQKLESHRRLVLRATALLTLVLLLLLEFWQLMTTLPPTLSPYEEGRLDYNSGAYTRALKALQQDLAERPDSQPTRLLLTQTAIALHQWTLAGSYLAELVRQSPNDPLIYYWIGRAQLGANQVDSAVASWSIVLNRTDGEALQVQPRIAAALGQLRFQQGRYAEANQLIYQALNGASALDSNEQQSSLYLYGILLARDLRFDEATSTLQHAINIGLPGNQLNNAPLQLRLDQTAARARTLLSRLPLATGEKAEGAKRAQLAYALLLAGEYPTAEEQFAQVLKVAPSYTDARAYLGVAYWRSGYTDQAIKVLNAVLAEMPSNRLAQQALAELLIDQLPALQTLNNDPTGLKQKTDQVQLLLKSLETEKPDDANLQLTIARYYVARHDYQSAQDHYQKALDLNKIKPVAGLNAGAVLSRYYSENNLDPCTRGVDTGLAATRDMPDDAESWYAAGLAYSKCGHADLAKPMLEKALELHPNWPEALYRLALSYDALSQHTEADRLFERLSDLDPDTFYRRLWQNS